MISFDDFSPVDGVPIYLQIIRHIKRGVVSGAVQNGDEMPSRRVLSALLGVNPNTIQKAYRLLEEEGLIESHSGAKSYVCLNDALCRAVRNELIEAEAVGVVSALKQMGLTKENALSLIEQYWNGGEEQ